MGGWIYWPVQLKPTIMKALKIITHPYTLIISFLLVIISGEHLGGFYALYLLLALYYGGVHSLLGLSGIILLAVARTKGAKNKTSFLPGLLNIGGAVLIVFSLVWFFYADKEGYNYGTFYQFIPRLSLILFGLIALLFIGRNLFQILKGKSINTKMSF